MFGNLSGIHLLVLVLVILLLFGAPKLPALARSMGQSMRIFRSEVKTMSAEKAADAGETTAAPQAGVEGAPASSPGAPFEAAAPQKQ